MSTIAILMILGWTLPASVSADVLEPSVLNEVEHALSRVPSAATTNGAVRTLPTDWPRKGFDQLPILDRAIALVSAQRADGRWFAGTNDVTAVVIRSLKRLAGEEERP